VQLWVNLPAKDKMTKPGYQAITKAAIPEVNMDGASVRVIAGSHSANGLQTRGAANTFSPMNVWDVRLPAGQTVSLPQPEGWTTLLLVQSGLASVNGAQAAGAAQMVVLSRQGTEVSITAQQDSQMLLLAGEPINEPVFGYGPFVMNTREEIVQAFNDFNAGKFGQIAA
jgi:quercetin 2,3-dioxygenase